MKRFTRWLRVALFNAYGHYPARIGGLPFKCDPPHFRFWRTLTSNSWEPATFDILDRFLRPDSVYCDVGAWIGPTVLYAARKCREVHCFEPDYQAYRHLLWNIQLNALTNVMPYNMAISTDDGVFSIAPQGKELGDSTSSLLNAENKAGMKVLAVKLDTIQNIALPRKIDFLKIDIEGAEFSLLPSIKCYLQSEAPILYLSTHAPYLDAAERAEKMRTLLSALEHYPVCLDERLNRIEPSHLLSEEVLGGFKSFLFLTQQQYTAS